MLVNSGYTMYLSNIGAGAMSQRAALHLRQRDDSCAEAGGSAMLLSMAFEGMEVFKL